MSNQRGESESASAVLVLVLLILFVYWLAADYERDGIVKYDDCRETVILPPDNFKKYYKTFTCSVRKTHSGRVMDGECVRVEYDSTLLAGGHTCLVAYVYQKKDTGCTDPKYPYLGYDDKCYTVPQ